MTAMQRSVICARKDGRQGGCDLSMKRETRTHDGLQAGQGLPRHVRVARVEEALAREAHRRRLPVRAQVLDKRRRLDLVQERPASVVEEV